jgi:3-hydroxyisobutyrate dehydrogenase
MERVGFIGLGTMGSAMAGHLLRAGYPTTVWNRTPGRASDLVAGGATEAATPADLARESDVVVLSVSDTPDVEAVLFGPDGVGDGVAAGLLVIDTSTIGPSATRSFAARLAGRSVQFVDAPVSGGSEGARNATLTIFAGGEPAAVERATPILEHLGRTITHVGPVGNGQAVKAVNQTIIAGGYLAVAEGIVLAAKAGLDLDQVVAALGAGAAGSWILANRSARMIANDYPLGFRTSLHLKDLGIALEMARQLGVALPVAGLAAQFENGLVARGYGDEDMSNLARVIREMSGLESPQATGTGDAPSSRSGSPSRPS